MKNTLSIVGAIVAVLCLMMFWKITADMASLKTDVSSVKAEQEEVSAVIQALGAGHSDDGATSASAVPAAPAAKTAIPVAGAKKKKYDAALQFIAHLHGGSDNCDSSGASDSAKSGSTVTLPTGATAPKPSSDKGMISWSSTQEADMILRTADGIGKSGYSPKTTSSP